MILTSSEHDTQRETVQRSLASVHHPDVFLTRKPVLCVVCEQPGTRGSMCDGCREAWLEGKKP